MRRHARSSTRSDVERRIDAALWGLVVVSVLMTLFWALGPRPPGARLFPRADKVFHALAFATMLGTFMLAAIWRPGRGTGPYPEAYAPAVATLLALGLVIELLQGELLGRDADLLDVAAEVLGMVAVTGALSWWRRRRR
jgi:hypothetical protein